MLWRYHHHHHHAISLLTLVFVTPTFHAFVPHSLPNNLPSPFSSLTAHDGKPTPEQQEQLDKYGPTPETSMEIFFDQLLLSEDNEGGAGETEEATPDFLAQTGSEAKAKWQSFLSNMKQIKQKGPSNDHDNTSDMNNGEEPSSLTP